MPHQTKPNPPMRRAEDARNMVGIGKARTAYIMPPACTHYQLLPSAAIKPNEPKNLDSIDSTVDTVVDRMGGGPQGRCTTDMTHTVRHPIMFADSGSAQDIRHGGPWPPHPAFASFWAYGLISTSEACYFGKEFLRMAGIAQMLHAHKPPYDKYPYAHGIRVRSL